MPSPSRRRNRTGLPLAVEPLEARYLLAVFTVTTTADSGPGSLRQAILDANAEAGKDRIEFAIDQGVQTIRPFSLLPEITEAVVLDATTQPGYQGTPLIELDGSGGAGIGIRIGGLGGSTVRGLAINRFGGSGITIGGGNNRSSFNHIAGNFIGTDVTGTIALPNRNAGVRVFGFDNRIGGTAPEDRNLIAGSDRGVDLVWARNIVQGNYIGTDVTGTKPLGNRIGVVISRTFSTGASDNRIGSSEPGAGNLISGNTQQGIFTVADQGTFVADTVIQGNFIGTDVSGLKPLGNGSGIVLTFAGRTQIGGSEPGAGNVVAFNQGAGISTPGGPVLGNVVYGNGGTGIGVGSSGNRVQGNWVVGNGGAGISLNFSGGTNRSLVGGTQDGETNFIGYNGGAGIVVTRGQRVALQGNALVGNAGLGIELRDGGNNDQNAPEVAGAALFGNRLYAGGWLLSRPKEPFELEFFASSGCDESGSGEGELFLGGRQAQTDQDGVAVFVEEFAAEVPAGWVVTATATDGQGNTSAFSACALVQKFGAPGGGSGGQGDLLAALLADPRARERGLSAQTGTPAVGC